MLSKKLGIFTKRSTLWRITWDRRGIGFCFVSKEKERPKCSLSLCFSSIFALFVYDVVQVFYDEVKDSNKPSLSLPFRV